jgi:hypothetical protein
MQYILQYDMQCTMQFLRDMRCTIRCIPVYSSSAVNNVVDFTADCRTQQQRENGSMTCYALAVMAL